MLRCGVDIVVWMMSRTMISPTNEGERDWGEGTCDPLPSQKMPTRGCDPFIPGSKLMNSFLGNFCVYVQVDILLQGYGAILST